MGTRPDVDALADALADRLQSHVIPAPISDSSLVGQLFGTGVPSVSQRFEKVEKPVSKPPRELALDWLRMYPEHLEQPGRWLEEHITPEGVTVSYKTWNRAKKELSGG